MGQEQQFQTDPIEKLYKVVKQKGYYTKSLDEFKKKYSTPEQIDSMYGVVNGEGLYTKSKDDFYSQYFPTLKKKESGVSQSSVGQLQSKKETVDEMAQYALPVSNEQMKQFEQHKAKFEGSDVAVSDDDPLGTVLTPFRQEAGKKMDNYMKGVEKSRTESVAQKYLTKTQQNKIDRDRRKLNQVDGDAMVKYEKIKEQAENELFPNGEVAKLALETYSNKKGVPIDELPEDNETIQAAKRKAAEYDMDAEDIFATNSIEDAAVRAERRNNKNFDEQVAALEQGFPHNRDYRTIIPEALLARVVDKFLAKGNAELIAQQDSDLKDQFDKLKDGGILAEFPTYGATIVANEMSRVREQEGKNNWFANLPKQDYMDDLAQRMYKDDPVKLKIYNEVIREDLPKYIDSPGFLDRGVSAVKHTVKGMGKSVSELAGQDNALALHENLQEAATQVSSDPQGFLHKLSSTSGDFGGLIAAMGIGGAALRGVGVSSGAANSIATGLTFYGDEMAQARQLYPNDETKQKIRAGLSTAAFMALNPLLQGTKGLQKRFFDKIMPDVDDIVSKVESGAITKEAAREGLLGKFKDAADFAKDAAGKNAKGTSEMVGLTMFKQGVDKVLGLDKQTYKEVHPDSEVVDVAKMTAMGLALPTIATASAGKKFAKDALFEISRNPKRYHNVSEVTSIVDTEFGKTKEERHANIEFLAETKNILDEVGLPDELQKSYLLHAMNEKILTKKAEGIKEPTLKKQITEQIKRSQQAKEKILKGENIDTLPQEMNADNLKENEKFLKEMFDGDETGSFLKAADRELLGGKTFDKEKVPDFLEFVAMQANNVMRGKDGELVTDSKFDSRKAAEERWEKPIIDAANEMYPEYKKLGDSQGEFKEAFTESSPPMQKPGAGPQTTAPSIIMPGEIKQPETTTIKPKENVPEQKAKISVQLPRQGEPTETITIGEKAQEPQQAGEPPLVRLTHADTEQIYTESGKPLRLETPTKHRDQLEREANEKLQRGYDFDQVAKETMEGTRKWEDTDQVLFAKKVADLQARQKDMDVTSFEFDRIQNEIEKLSRASDVAGTISARHMESRKHYVPEEKTISNAIMEEKAVTGSDILTDKQKQDVAREFTEEQTAQKKWDEKKAKLTEDRDNKEAQNAINKMAKEKGDKPKKDYSERRAKLKERLKQEFEDYKNSINKVGIKADGGAEATIISAKMAKTILEISKEYIEEGVVKLADVIKKTLDDVKEFVPGVTDRDIRDVIAGKYSQQKTRSELAIALQDLRTEQNLIDKIEQLEKGELPKSEKKKRKRNREITDLQNKLRALKSEYVRENADASKLESYKDRMKIQIEKIHNQIKNGEFAPPKKPEPIQMDAEAIRLKDRLIKIKNEKRLRQLKIFYQKQTDRDKAIRLAIEIANVPRAIMASMDFSALLRQAIIPTIARPRTAFRYDKNIEGKFKDKLQGSVAEMFRGGGISKIL